MQTRLLRPIGAALAAILVGIGVVLLPGTAPSAHADGANKLMLVMDSSGSMKEKLSDGGTKISAARSALNAVIDGLPESQQVGLRVYGAKVFDRSDKGACTDSQRVVDLGTDNRAALRSAVAKYKPYGETPTGYALQQAGKDLGSDGQRTIVLVSDGEPTCAPDPCDVAGELAQQGIDLKIDVVGLDVSGKARAMLRCIAQSGHGHYYDADSAEDIGRALDTVATRSLRPYKPSGKPITGTETAEGAPALAAGDWLDKIGGMGKQRGDLFYTLRRTIPGSTFHLSASMTTATDDNDGLSLRLFGDAEDCGMASETHGVNYGQVISVALTAPGSRDWDEKCTQNDEFTVEISRGIGASLGGDNTVPLEIRVDEEPPVAEVDSLPKDLGEPEFTRPASGTATKIVGGSSFAEATDIKPGTFTGNLVPGEVQIFEVPVDWGQHLNAETVIKPLSQQQRDEVGLHNVWLNVKLFSPSRGKAENPLKSKTQELVSTSGADGTAVSHPVAYRNRTSLSDSVESVNRAGNYYVVIGLSPVDGLSAQFPYTLRVGVDGEVRGKPSYLKSGSTPTPSASPGSPSPRATPSTVQPSRTATAGTQASATAHATPAVRRVADRAAGAVRTVGFVVGGLGITAVLAGAAGLVIHLARRR